MVWVRRTNERRNCHACGQVLPVDRPRDIRDFWYFDGVPPRNITIANVDGIFHDGPTDRLLVFETKRQGEALKPGQRGLLESIARREGVEVVVLRDDRPYIISETLQSNIAYRLTYDDTRAGLRRWFGGAGWGPHA